MFARLNAAAAVDPWSVPEQLEGWQTISPAPFDTRDLAGALRRSEDLFRSAFECTNVAMVLTDVDNHFIRVNAAFARLFGYSEDEVLQKTLADVTHPDDLGESLERRQFLLTGVAKYFQMEKRYIHKDGHVFWGLANISLVRDAAGRPLEYVGQVQDITERKRSEEERRRLVEDALRQSEERFHLFVDSVEDYAILMLDARGHVATWNHGAQRMKGYQPQEILGRHFSCFYPEADRAAGRPERLLKAAAANGRVEDESWRVRKDGSRFWANVVLTALRDRNGELRGFAKVTRDFSERKRAEDERNQAEERIVDLNSALAARITELDAANHELESFCYSISHDLRAPLRAIDGFSRIVLKDFASDLPPAAVGYLDDVRANTLQMGRLIDDLLAFSRLSRQPLKKETVDPARLVGDCLRELVPRAPDPQSEGRPADVRVGALKECQADPALLKQVWFNLISNALKYSGKSPAPVVEIGCRVARQEGEPQGTTIYFVKDNGVGFDMKYAGKLFGVFQRLHRAEDYAGTGVGLAIVQRIVNRHGGRVWAESQPRQGAAFYFSLEGAAADD